eukprot:GHVL01030763.1.p1 GENE.GHVL01030763.1~~GHVL01030763.1.p1  ORF type:complete len:740 (-),score=203.13 GHVL01030763.1:692-2911(-)
MINGALEELQGYQDEISSSYSLLNSVPLRLGGGVVNCGPVDFGEQSSRPRNLKLLLASLANRPASHIPRGSVDSLLLTAQVLLESKRLADAEWVIDDALKVSLESRDKNSQLACLYLTAVLAWRNKQLGKSFRCAVKCYRLSDEAGQARVFVMSCLLLVRLLMTDPARFIRLMQFERAVASPSETTKPADRLAAGAGGRTQTQSTRLGPLPYGEASCKERAAAANVSNDVVTDDNETDDNATDDDGGDICEEAMKLIAQALFVLPKLTDHTDGTDLMAKIQLTIAEIARYRSRPDLILTSSMNVLRLAEGSVKLKIKSNSVSPPQGSPLRGSVIDSTDVSTALEAVTKVSSDILGVESTIKICNMSKSIVPQLSVCFMANKYSTEVGSALGRGDIFAAETAATDLMGQVNAASEFQGSSISNMTALNSANSIRCSNGCIQEAFDSIKLAFECSDLSSVLCPLDLQILKLQMADLFIQSNDSFSGLIIATEVLYVGKKNNIKILMIKSLLIIADSWLRILPWGVEKAFVAIEECEKLMKNVFNLKIKSRLLMTEIRAILQGLSQAETPPPELIKSCYDRVNDNLMKCADISLCLHDFQTLKTICYLGSRVCHQIEDIFLRNIWSEAFQEICENLKYVKKFKFENLPKFQEIKKNRVDETARLLDETFSSIFTSLLETVKKNENETVNKNETDESDWWFEEENKMDDESPLWTNLTGHLINDGEIKKILKADEIENLIRNI